MDRFVVRCAAVTFCVAGMMGVSGSARAADAPAATAQPAPTEAPATLIGEITKAHLARVRGDYAEAGKDLGQLMLVAPDDPRVVGEFGKVLAQQGRPAEAIPFLKRAIQLKANDWSLYSALGVAYDQTDDHAEARLAYEHALSLRPGTGSVLNNYAVSRMLAGDYAGAGKLLAQASATGMADPKISANLALLDTMSHPAAPAANAVYTPNAANAAPANVASTPQGVIAHPATGAPKVLASVMMQRVPADPKAGPVARHAALDRKLARAVSHKPAAHEKRLAAAASHSDSQAVAHPPMLRTAADGQ